MFKAIESPDVTQPLSAYSQAVRVDDYIFVSGQGPLDRDAHIVGSDISSQTEAALENLKQVLVAAGCTLRDVARVTVYLRTITDYDEFNRVYERYFDVAPFPARTCIGAGELWSEVLVEIDAIARVANAVR